MDNWNNKKDKTIIRRWEKKDIAEIAILEKKLFTSPALQKTLNIEFENESAEVIVIEDETGIVGYSWIRIHFEEAHVMSFGVKETSRNLGHGKRLMIATLARARSREAELMLLEVRETNFAARKLYASIGFKTEAMRKKYYDNVEDALIMWNRNLLKSLKAHNVYIRNDEMLVDFIEKNDNSTYSIANEQSIRYNL